MRITLKKLESLCEYLNEVTESPIESYVRIDGRNVGQIGNFYISSACGGYNVNRISNEGGGCTEPLGSGHRPARELYEQMNAFIDGYQLALGAK